MDFGKLYCKVHPYELITNFCAHCIYLIYAEQCLIGLCATCVCHHSQYHTKNGTHTSYQNIRITYADLQKDIRDQIIQLQQSKNRINIVIDLAEKKKNKLKEIIESTRKQCIILINEHFANLLKQTDDRIYLESSKNGYHNLYRFDSLNNVINKQISNLTHITQQLNSHNFLDALKRIKKQELPNAQQIKNHINRELDQNQQYGPYFEYDSSSLSQLDLALRKILSIQFEYPICLLPHQMLRQIDSKIVRKNHQYNQSDNKTYSCSESPTQNSFKKTLQNTQNFFNSTNKSNEFVNTQIDKLQTFNKLSQRRSIEKPENQKIQRDHSFISNENSRNHKIQRNPSFISNENSRNQVTMQNNSAVGYHTPQPYQRSQSMPQKLNLSHSLGNFYPNKVPTFQRTEPLFFAKTQDNFKNQANQPVLMPYNANTVNIQNSNNNLKKIGYAPHMTEGCEKNYAKMIRRPSGKKLGVTVKDNPMATSVVF